MNLISLQVIIAPDFDITHARSLFKTCNELASDSDNMLYPPKETYNRLPIVEFPIHKITAEVLHIAI
jgi:hypothetical protein